MYRRWTSAQPLELHAPWISNVCTDLQPVYLTLTPVGGCGEHRPWLGQFRVTVAGQNHMAL